MKKNYKAPEAELICLETEEPITADLNIISNIFPLVDNGDDRDAPVNL